MERIFGWCTACGEIVVRHPYKRHGDGQVDSDENQIWLLSSREEAKEADVSTYKMVYCGCME